MSDRTIGRKAGNDNRDRPEPKKQIPNSELLSWHEGHGGSDFPYPKSWSFSYFLGG
jgi:hypothetical protein